MCVLKIVIDGKKWEFRIVILRVNFGLGNYLIKFIFLKI